MPAADDTLFPFTLPILCKKKVTAAFDGGTIGSDGGVLLLMGADKRLGLIERLAGLFPDGRDPTQIIHPMADILRERIYAIAGTCPREGGGATRTATTSTPCGAIRRSKWPAGACRRAAPTWPHNRRSPGWRTRPTCTI